MTLRLSKIHLAAHTTVQHIVCLHARTFQSVLAFVDESPNNHPVQLSGHPEKSFYMLHLFQIFLKLHPPILPSAFCVFQMADTTLCPNGSEKQYVLLFSLFSAFPLIHIILQLLLFYPVLSTFVKMIFHPTLNKRFRKHLRLHSYLGILFRFIGLWVYKFNYFPSSPSNARYATQNAFSVSFSARTAASFSRFASPAKFAKCGSRLKYPL